MGARPEVQTGWGLPPALEGDIEQFWYPPEGKK
jgi:hypothetical protein